LGKPVFGDFGLDLTARDQSVNPGDDFFRHANGSWIKTAVIPPDQPAAGVDYDVFNTSQAQLREIIEGAGSTSLIGGLYRSFMNEAQVERADITAIKPELDAIQSIQTLDQFVVAMGRAQSGFGSSLVSLSIDGDPKNPDLNVLWIGQSGLGLPDRGYYLDDSFKPQRQAYQDFAGRALAMAGRTHASARAAAILAFETRIAKVSWAATERRDIEKAYRPMSLAELQSFAPELNWNIFFAAARVQPRQKMIVSENTAVREIAKILKDTPLETLKDWQTFQVIAETSPYLSNRFVQSRFKYVASLTGQTRIRPRWKRGVVLVDSSLGELIGQTYVERHFPATSKAQLLDLVADLKTAMADRIRSVAWMSPQTKGEALDKLTRMKVMIGYPDKWRDYSGLKIDHDDLMGNVRRSREFEWSYTTSQLERPVDKLKWSMNPQEVNAYNSSLENKIVFPAGILQPPFFDPAADPAVNYGAIGAVIGHEISHGFDDEGRKIDSHGALRDWWTAEDAKRFEAQAEILGKQFDSFEPYPGTRINGKLTMGENIADLAGLLLALDAYHASLKGQPAPVIDGLTGDQRLFLSYGQYYRAVTREDAEKSQIASDPHSPNAFRVIGSTRNIDSWYDAFQVQASGKYYLAPDQRARIW
jgi:putative endopeptidase